MGPAAVAEWIKKLASVGAWHPPDKWSVETNERIAGAHNETWGRPLAVRASPRWRVHFIYHKLTGLRSESALSAG